MQEAPSTVHHDVQCSHLEERWSSFAINQRNAYICNRPHNISYQTSNYIRLVAAQSFGSILILAREKQYIVNSATNLDILVIVRGLLCTIAVEFQTDWQYWSPLKNMIRQCLFTNGLRKNGSLSFCYSTYVSTENDSRRFYCTCTVPMS